MVAIKQLDPNYPRLGYEIKKGLVIDLPRGDGKADIVILIRAPVWGAIAHFVWV